MAVAELLIMKINDNQSKNKRQYPPFWEKFVPIAIGIIVTIIIILIIIIFAVALGLFPDSVNL